MAFRRSEVTHDHHSASRTANLDSRSSAEAAPADAPHPPLRGEVCRAVHAGQDPRLPAPVHRRGGGGGRGDAGPDAGRRHRLDLPRARPRPGPRDVAPAPIMAEMFGKANGCSRGRGGSMHLFDAPRRFYGGNAIVGGGLPIAVGLALADKLQSRRASRPASSATARWPRASSTSRSTWRPCGSSRCCSSARTTCTRWAPPWRGTRPRPTSPRRPRPTACPARPSMAWMSWPSRRRRARRVETVRGGGGPFLLEARTYRFRAHSMYDAELYRGKEEVEQWKQRDPIAIFDGAAAGRRLADRRGPGGWRRPWRPRSTRRSPSPRPGRGSRSRTCTKDVSHAGDCHDDDDLPRSGPVRRCARRCAATPASS